MHWIEYHGDEKEQGERERQSSIRSYILTRKPSTPPCPFNLQLPYPEPEPKSHSNITSKQQNKRYMVCLDGAIPTPRAAPGAALHGVDDAPDEVAEQIGDVPDGVAVREEVPSILESVRIDRKKPWVMGS